MENLQELLSNPAVIWFLIGLAFLSLEMIIPGLIILFFGIGCWVTSLAYLLMPELSFNAQMIIFLVSSVLSLILLRKTLKKWIHSRKKDDKKELEEYVGKHCVAETDFISGVGGKVSFKGALWNAESKQEVKKGDNLIIKSVESIRLTVEPI